MINAFLNEIILVIDINIILTMISDLPVDKAAINYNI